MPRKKTVTPEELGRRKSLRRRFARGERKTRKKLVSDFDWSTVPIPEKHRPEDYKYRCSTKCERANGNAPLSYSGNGIYGQYRDEKGKLRWMFSFVRRSERDDMLRDCKKMNGCKARKEPNRE